MLSDEMVAKIRAMGVPKHEFVSLSSGRIKGRISLEEADEAYKPLPIRV